MYICIYKRVRHRRRQVLTQFTRNMKFHSPHIFPQYENNLACYCRYNRYAPPTTYRRHLTYRPVRTALFWIITQRRVVTTYRRFGSTYTTVRLSGNVGKELPPLAM